MIQDFKKQIIYKINYLGKDYNVYAMIPKDWDGLTITNAQQLFCRYCKNKGALFHFGTGMFELPIDKERLARCYLLKIEEIKPKATSLFTI